MHKTQPNFEVVATGGDMLEAVRICRELRPDVVLIDIRMPGMKGMEATTRGRRRCGMALEFSS